VPLASSQGDGGKAPRKHPQSYDEAGPAAPGIGDPNVRAGTSSRVREIRVLGNL
jgi:hypothetical protein